jgi:hypothetical protein
LSKLKEQISKVDELLQKFKTYIEDHPTSDNTEASFAKFEKVIDETFTIFNKISNYPVNYFTDISHVDWANIWSIIQSNIYGVQGIAQSCKYPTTNAKKIQ